MIIPEEFTKRGYTIKGVVHIGSNDCEEVTRYFDLGIRDVICFDPLPKAAAFALNRFHADPRIVIVPAAFGEKDSYQWLTVTSGHGQQSTFLPVVDTRTAYGEYRPEYQVLVHVARFDDFMSKAPLELYRRILKCNCLVIDVQGMEERVLVGMGRFLSQFSYAGIECSTIEVYQQGARAGQVIERMDRAGFSVISDVGYHSDVLFAKGQLEIPF